MRILFITASYLPTINGVSYQIDILKTALEKEGHKVFILAPSFPGYEDNNQNVFRYPSLPNPVVKNYPIGVPLFPIGKIKGLKPDVVHVHHPLMVGKFGRMVSEKLSIPLIFTSHTQYEQYIDFYMLVGKTITKKFFEKDLTDLAKKCFKVICPSKKTGQRLKKLGINNTKIIFNSIENGFSAKTKKKTLHNPTIVYTGRIEKEKNIPFLLKTARELKKMLPSFRLLIIGDGSQLSGFKKMTGDYGLEGNVLFAGQVNRMLLPQIYQRAHIFMTASNTEVMPLTLIEAMSCGLPVIALQNSGLEDIVLNAKTGYLIKADPDKAAKKIADIFNNQKLYNTLSRTAYSHSLNFSVDKKAKEHLSLYKEAIKLHKY